MEFTFLAFFSLSTHLAQTACLMNEIEMYMKICYHDIGQIVFHQHEQENNGLTLTWPHHYHHYQSLPSSVCLIGVV